MRRIVIVAALLGACLLASPAFAQGSVYVQGYVRSDGTYVQPHYRSSPNSTTLDNWSTRGNVNPYTGQVGTRDPYASTFRAPRNSYVSPYAAPRYDSYGNRQPKYQ